MTKEPLIGKTRLPSFAEPWSVVRLGDHVRYLKTVALSRAQLDPESPVRYLHYGDIHTSSRVRLDAASSEMPRVSPILIGSAEFLKVGDLVFADASEDLAGVGKSIEVTSIPHGGLIAGLHTIAARFDKSVLTDGFKAYLQFIPDFRAALLRLAAGTKVLAITRAHVSSVSLLLPDVEEQSAIFRALSDVGNLTVELERLIAKKRAIKQGMMQQLLTGKTRLPGFSEPWEQVRLGDVARMGSGGTPQSSISEYYGGGIPWVSISDMTGSQKFVLDTDKTLSNEGLINSAAMIYEDGVVLYAMYASLGECAIAVGEVASSQAILGIAPSERLDRDYLYYYLSSIKADVKNLGQHGTQSNLNAGMVRGFMFELPSIGEQRAIAAILGDSDDEMDLLRARLNKAKAIKQGMMQELLTGRTRLPVSKDAS